ncbi:hypothetical protein F9817_08755 [Vibrio sp. CAIM 722]|uniref:Membrane-bound metal-dependent hydrolase n=1 Tax=Vibrio eleionomae TaxID=2653505 RepID=A0A7X4LJW3_9VIBR|nr:hypothetical protein [Vibrio eleionomae]MZI93284.1 hypothetical protein [Vibrio eleionomae]
MNRKGHRITAALTVSVPIVIGIKQHLPWPIIAMSIIGCAWGVTAPDDVEIRYTTESDTEINEDGSKAHVSKTLFDHRGMSHDIALWIALFSFSWWWLFISHFHHGELAWDLAKGALFGATYGALIHLLADLPNGRSIPLFPFGPRVCLHLWKASENEALMGFILFVLSSLLAVRIALGNNDWIRVVTHDVARGLEVAFHYLFPLLITAAQWITQFAADHGLHF